MALRKIGEAVTGTNGKCVIPYTGVGVGRLQMRGQYEEDGRVIQSETYSLIDAKFKDTATSHNTKWWATGTLSITEQNDGILVENNNASGYVLDYTYLTDNFPSSWSERENAVTCHERPFCAEFDIISVSNLSQTGLFIGNSSTAIHTYFGSLGLSVGHIKIEALETQVKFYLDGTLVNTTNLANVTLRFGFRINAGNSFKYDNLVIYPI